MVDAKSELLVFTRKEMAVLVSLVVLVTAFAFTLGIRLGKNLAMSYPATTEPVAAVLEKQPVPPEAAKEEHAEESSAATSTEHAAAKPEHVDTKSEHAAAAPAQNKAAAIAEDRADAELNAEAHAGKAEAKLALPKPMPLALPTEKLADSKDSRYTLQVGSHRTVAEAAEQVSTLKHHDLDAFYLEARVPGKGTWYRVGVGLFPSKEVAEQTAVKWKESKTLPPYIVQKIE